jgi:hypothetical protein
LDGVVNGSKGVPEFMGEHGQEFVLAEVGLEKSLRPIR